MYKVVYRIDGLSEGAFLKAARAMGLNPVKRYPVWIPHHFRTDNHDGYEIAGLSYASADALACMLRSELGESAGRLFVRPM